MHYAHKELEKLDDLDLITPHEFSISAQDVLRKSYELVTCDAKAEKLIGSCTALIVVLRVN